MATDWGARPARVSAYEEAVVIPTYPASPPDRNPMFLEKRVYQGSSGKVYPNAFTDRVSNERIDKSYRAVFIENEYIRLMLLPEIGGRIHIGQDKTNDYDFFYRQTVIKPALVGLLGPWISGGVEFNWPQHHRPSTFMPVQHFIERHDDGSCTVWLSEHEPMQRMKGMVGISLSPNSSLVEAKVRLYNRTPLLQSFLWWANVGVHVHDQYQAFFPPDVSYVADHAKRAMSTFPIARNFYYGVDYRKGVDISWYRNIPVPTSYMVVESNFDFFGGYDHKRRAGVVHVADRHIAPGKKLWTWGNAEFGYAWDRELTDSDGPYIELMAGVYTDNQPDFSWLEPFETRTFSQYWYPIQEIGPAKNAGRHAAVNLESDDGKIRIGVCVTRTVPGAKVLLRAGDEVLLERACDLVPRKAFVEEVARPRDERDLTLSVIAPDGSELISYRRESFPNKAVPPPATAPPAPKDISSNDELYLIGLHLDQYRHATRYPEPYWQEALSRDPYDCRSNVALGLLSLRRGQLAEAEQLFRRAIASVTRRNPNPLDGSAYYYLGIALQLQDRLDEAYDALYKSAWNYRYKSAAYYRMAEIDCRCAAWETALQHLQQSLATNVHHLKARNLQTAILRTLGRRSDAMEVVRQTLAIDPLDFWARNELHLLKDAGDEDSALPDVQMALDIALDYASAGLWREAANLLHKFAEESGSSYPMIFYVLGSLAADAGDNNEALACWRKAAMMPPDYCFPARVGEMLVLERALAANPSDARGHYYLGNLLYDKKRHEQAILHWEKSCELEPDFAIPWRNLGIAYFNIRRDPQRALDAYERAFAANQRDARLLFELDQLRRRLRFSPQKRLTLIDAHPHLVSERDDLTVERVTLLNVTEDSQKALEILLSRRFHPWEGGEGLVSGQYVWAHLLLGRRCLDDGQTAGALEHFETARHYPQNLGEGKHLLTLETHLDFFSGMALERLGKLEAAQTCLRRAAGAETDNSAMTYYRALALERLGQRQASIRLLESLLQHASAQIKKPVEIDYFATSLPNFLLFEEDLQLRNQIDCLYLMALAELGLQHSSEGVEHLRKVLELEPAHVGATAELRRVEQEGCCAPAAIR